MIENSQKRPGQLGLTNSSSYVGHSWKLSRINDFEVEVIKLETEDEELRNCVHEDLFFVQ